MNADVELIPDEPKPILVSTGVATERSGLRVQHMMYWVGVCAVVVWLATVTPVWLIVGAIVLMFAGAIASAVLFARRTSTQQESLLWALAIAAERSMPLAPAALAFADQFNGSFRARVQLLASLLNDGHPLPEALDQVPGLFTREADVLVRTGWSTGTLARSLREAAAARTMRQAVWGALASRFFYIANVFLFIQVISGFIIYFYAPRYEAIFRDFGIKLPRFTIATINFSHMLGDFAGGAPLILLILLELIILALLPFGLFNVFEWNLPFTDYIYRRRHTTLVLRSLALATEGGKPITSGLASLVRDYPSSWVRKRLIRVDDDIRRGLDWVVSLEENDLLRQSDAGVLSAAQRVGNLSWALREMAESNERRLGYRLQFWLQMLFPLAVIALGALVFVFCVAYFAPLVRLIEVLSG